MIVASVIALSVAASTSWCDALGSVLDEPPAPDDAARVAHIERALGTLPQEAQAVQGQVRGLLGKDGSLDAARAALEAVRRDGCAPVPVHAGAPGDEVAALVASDERFGGVRVGDDVLDRVLDRVWRWLTSFLESEGMRRYAGSARALYLAALALGVVFVVFRLVRAWRTAARADEEQKADARARVEQQRQRAAHDLLTEAEGALTTDPHRAAALTYAALLARVGEQAPGAVTPARTGREVIARLDASRAGVVRAPLELFDTVYFGRATSADDARALLAAARDAERALTHAAGTR